MFLRTTIGVEVCLLKLKTAWWEPMRSSFKLTIKVLLAAWCPASLWIGWNVSSTNHLEISSSNWSGAIALCTYGSRWRCTTKLELFPISTRPQNVTISKHSFQKAQRPESITAVSVLSCFPTKSVSSFSEGSDRIFIVRLILFLKHIFLKESFWCTSILKHVIYFRAWMCGNCNGLLPAVFSMSRTLANEG